MHFERKRFTGEGVEVLHGARSRHHSNLELIRFQFFAVCDQVNPEAWHGEVLFGSRTLLRTASFPDELAAGKQAERAFEARVVALFGQGGQV
jgi:hypothetical protein